ncbi:MAG TPA: glycosyltransferase family 39 protein [Lysobacter sp.]
MISNSVAKAGHDADVPATHFWQRGLLWLGAPLCVAGFVIHRLNTQWNEGRFIELLVLAALSLAVAAVLRRLLRWPLASGLALVWALALAFFAGPLPTAATVLFALAALSLGDLLGRGAPVAARIACGLMLFAGVLGWLLPLPIHYRWLYWAAIVALIAWHRRPLARSARDLAAQWHSAVGESPRIAAFAVIVLGLASTGCWIPTMQADDVVYHLRLPWQLMGEHHYPLAPQLHIWSMAPWAADVLQAVPQLLAGAEARGGLNALWIVLTASGVWSLAVVLGGTPRTAWFAVALYASLPLTAGLAGGMQTEAPTAALLVWLAWAILASRNETSSRKLWLGAVLMGGLLALKLASAAFALVLLAWAIWEHRHRLPSPLASLGAVLMALAVAGSSYVYAAWIARNPFLPLFNAWFRSPYYDPANFDDARWHGGINAALPWNLTFHTERYLEAFAGGGGFVLIALAGAWLLAFTQGRTRALAIVATVLVVLPLIPLQYLRYLFPALVLLVPVLALITFRFDPRRASWLLIGVCVLNLAFQANSFWLLRIGMVKMTIMEAGRDAPLFRAHVPERNLIAAIRNTPHGTVLALDPDRPYVAELGVQGRSISAYDRTLQRAARFADADPSGATWIALLRNAGVTDVLLRPGKETAPQRAALGALRAERKAVEGDLEWWHVPAGATR